MAENQELRKIEPQLTSFPTPRPDPPAGGSDGSSFYPCYNTFMTFPSFEYEKKFWNQGTYTIGIDEVGRGACAGPVYVAAVLLPPTLSQEDIQSFSSMGINDSKKLSAPKRQKIFTDLMNFPMKYSICSSSVAVINTHGILHALQQAMQNAVMNIIKYSDQKNTHILIDGDNQQRIQFVKFPQTTIIGGDSLSLSIAAASILAKVTRDSYMAELHTTLPEYNWSSNKGYGTKDHFAGIKTHGITSHHRHLYLRKFLATMNV